MVIVVDEDVEVLPTHRWMTLGQVKAMMAFDNLVNMDTRTVLSCIPLAGFDDEHGGSVWGVRQSELVDAFRRLNDFKMFDYSKRRVVPLGDLSQWRIDPFAIEHVDSAPFKVICCDIAIEGREVKHWRQPLFEAVGKALFGLLATRGSDGAMRFLVKVTPEAGCFDRAEFGPTLQLEAGWEDRRSEGAVQDRFLELLARGEGVLHDVILSEEGGRFFCEENRNVVIEVCASEACALEAELPRKYVWLDFVTLNLMCQFNNVCNIQLRNLLSLLSADEL